MAFDAALTARLHAALTDIDGLSDKKMMGGVCFFWRGNMLCGADRPKSGEPRFMFRVGKDNEAKALKLPGAKRVDLGGRRMPGFVFVDAQSCDDEALGRWVTLARAYSSTLPPK